MKNRIIIIFSGFLLMWALLIVRAVRVQVIPDERLENLKRRQFETSLNIHTRRGAILDRNGKELAASIPAYSLFADPKMIEEPRKLALRLGKKLNLSPKVLAKLLKNKQKRFIWIKRQLDENMRDTIRSWETPGLGFVEEPKRVYPNGNLLAPLLGMVGSEDRGLEGVELQFEKILAGNIKTILLPRDARGRPLLEDGRSLTEVPDGADIELTIDHEIQFAVEQELRRVTSEFRAESAIGLVVDPKSAEIMAMASVGDIDRNRSITDAFEPGSTMKTFVIAGALHGSVVRPSTRYFCERGHMKVGSRWISEAESDHSFEWLTVSEILAKSSNIGTAKIAFDLGAERLNRILADFGFGAKTGISLPGEARGIVNPLPWRQHLLSNISFGQGIAVTPLQLAMAYSAVANGGMLKEPLIVRSIHKPGEETEHFVAKDVRRVLTPQEASTMRLMLTAATLSSGTGGNATIPGYLVGGKTGTAQKVDFVKGGYMKNGYISSFAGFVPAHDPKYVIYIAVDNPQKAYYGSQVAAPVFSRLAQYLVRRDGISPVLISEANVINHEKSESVLRNRLQAQAIAEIKNLSAQAGAAQEAATESAGFPNLLGLSLREALAQVRDRSGPVTIKGSGVVVKTIPAAGAQGVRDGRRVTLILENPD